MNGHFGTEGLGLRSIRQEASGSRTGLLLAVAALSGGTPVFAQQGVEAPPFIATPDPIVELMLDMADVGEGDVVYDLGSGDGRLVIAAAGRGARAVGVEYDERLVAASRENARRAGVQPRASFVHGDIFEVDVGPADVAMLYLSPEFNLRLRPKLLRELRPGARVVSHAFHMGGWAPDEERTLGEGLARAIVYRWTVPAVVDGFWWLELGDSTGFAIELSQTFQAISGQAWVDGHPLRLTGEIEGLMLELVVHPTEDSGRGSVRFQGQLRDGVLLGVAEETAGAGTRPARAVRFSHPSRAPVGP